jgi:hypothetical protein
MSAVVREERKFMVRSRGLTYNVGVNDADYVTEVKETTRRADGKQKIRFVWACPFYRAWKDMIKRGYSDKYKAKNLTYQNVTVYKDWHLFSNFKTWMEQQDWEGKQLDKDILFPGNKEYHPNKCAFVLQKTNKFLTECDSKRGIFPIGVSWYDYVNKFRAQCSDGTGRTIYLGLHKTVESAFLVWLEKKRELSYIVAADESDPRVKEAIINRYKNYPIPDFSQYPTLEEITTKENK